MVSCKDNHSFKEAAYDKLVTNVNAIDTKIPSTSRAATKTQYEKQIEDAVKKIPSSSGLFNKIDYNAKITEITTAALITKAKDLESKILDITNLAHNAALNAKSAKVESKTCDITNLNTKTVLNTKATQTESRKPYTAVYL